MTDTGMNFQAPAPKIPPRILCIGMPVRDLTFRVQGLPARGSKENASHFDEICGGNALNGAIGYDKGTTIVKRATDSGRPLREIALEEGVDAKLYDATINLRKIARGNQ